MRTARVGVGLLAGFVILVGGAAPAAPTAETILKWRPRQEGVLYSTPSAKEVEACKVEAVTGKTKGAGWLLRDPQGRPLRRFYDSQYDGRTKSAIDVWSYYYEGVETYREYNLNTREEPDQMHFRWLNAGGMKWGVDLNKDGKIDFWKVISPEEISQEVLQAFVKKDPARLQALMISEAEIKTLELGNDFSQRLRDLRRGAEAKFQSALAKLPNLNENTHWLHLETSPPQCLPAEQTGARTDLVRQARGTVLCETAGKNDWLQTGEMIQVGPATWRLVDGPTAGQDEGDPRAGTVAENPELQKLLKELSDLDGEWSKKASLQTAGPEVVRYNLDRAALIERVLSVVKHEERDQWLRQQADGLSAAAQSSPPEDKKAYERLKQLVAQVEKSAPAGSLLLAYVTYREMQADYNSRLSNPKNNPKDFATVQQDHLDRLAKFVRTFPAAEDSPEALLALGWVSETVGKEIEAKNWYQQLARDFADKPHGARAKGAIRRLELEGNLLELAGTTLTGTGFDLASLRGKPVVVYYWSGNSGQSAVGDFAKLKLLLETYGAKGLELVTVNLDTSAEEANAFVKRISAPGTHLFQAGGMDCKLATDYGILMLPNLFLVNKEGKVVNRGLQVNNLDDELKKLLK